MFSVDVIWNRCATFLWIAASTEGLHIKLALFWGGGGDGGRGGRGRGGWRG